MLTLSRKTSVLALHYLLSLYFTRNNVEAWKYHCYFQRSKIPYRCCHATFYFHVFLKLFLSQNLTIVVKKKIYFGNNDIFASVIYAVVLFSKEFCQYNDLFSFVLQLYFIHKPMEDIYYMLKITWVSSYILIYHFCFLYFMVNILRILVIAVVVWKCHRGGNSISVI